MPGKIIDVNALKQHNLDMQKYGIYISRERSMPEYRDGLKPVQRRILYDMLNDTKAVDRTIKTNRVVGSTMGIYHAHGDSSILGAIKPMVNWFEINKPLITGQGNFGNFQGDDQSASRYTEVKLSKFCMDCMMSELQLNRNVVDWSPTYEGICKEPDFLPAKVPMLLINGSFGIALGFKVEIPKHNFNEVIDATINLIDHPNASVVLIPDHCMPCEIIDTDWKSISNKGNGTYKVRGIIDIGEYHNKPALFIRSVPDLTFLDKVTEGIEKLIEDNKIIQISDMIENSEKDKMEYIIVLKKGADPNFIRDIIYKNTEIEKTCRVNFEVLDGINPLRMSYKSYLQAFINFRKLTKFRLISNEIQYLQTKIHESALYITVLKSGEVDNIIKMIKKQKTTDDTPIIEFLIKKFKMTDLQAKFILNTDLRKLSLAYLSKYEKEAKECGDKVNNLMRYIFDDNLILEEIKKELSYYKMIYGNKRRSKIITQSDASGIPSGNFKIVITNNNYIKKVPINDSLGGFRGDSPKIVVVSDNTDDILLFDNQGKVFKMEVHKIPFVDKNSNGTDIRLLIKRLTSNITNVIPLPTVKFFADKIGKHFMMIILSNKGYIKKLDLEDFLTVPASGIMFMKLDEDDYIKGILIANDKSDVIVYSSSKAIRLNMNNIPYLKRNTKGLRAMKTEVPIDGMSLILKNTKDIVVVTNNGMVNKFIATALQESERGSSGNKVIKLKKGDGIKFISGVQNSDILRIYSQQGIGDFKVSDIPESSSISEGTKLVPTKGNVIIRCNIIQNQ